MSHNPYTPPAAVVEDARPALVEETFVPNGRRRAIGHGWKWIADGWTLFQRQPVMWIVALVVFYAFMMLLSLVPAVGFAATFIGPIIGAGFMAMADKAHRQERFNLGELVAGFRHRAGPLLLLGIIYLAGFVVILGVLMLVFGWSVGMSFITGKFTPEDVGKMFTIVGVYLVMVMGWATTMIFSPQLVYFNGVSAFDSLKMSFLACVKNTLPGLWFAVIYTLLFLVSMLPLLLGLFVTLPLGIAAVYAAYRDIFLEPTNA